MRKAAGSGRCRRSLVFVADEGRHVETDIRKGGRSDVLSAAQDLGARELAIAEIAMDFDLCLREVDHPVLRNPRRSVDPCFGSGSRPTSRSSRETAALKSSRGVLGSACQSGDGCSNAIRAGRCAIFPPQYRQSRPPRSYERHRPEETVLHQVFVQHLPEFLVVQSMLARAHRLSSGPNDGNLRPMSELAFDRAPGFRDVPRTALVTGSSGFVGQRLVEMLVERGAERVVAFDIAPAPADALDHPAIHYIKGDITSRTDVLAASEGVECCFHLAALVGPFHEERDYERVNYGGTIHVVEACRKHRIRKLVMSSSPSTRFPYPDPNVRGLTEDELERMNGGCYSPSFHASYARTKAMAEKAVLEACSEELMTLAVAPHQVYGPRDTLFLPAILEAAQGGKLRIFGNGENRISFTHVDNYCHALILGAEALRPGSEALGRFYIVTDDGPQLLWTELDRAITGVGLPSLQTRRPLPAWFMMAVARVTMGLGTLIAFFSRRSYPQVMRRLKLNTFAVRMLIIDRWFDIQRAKRELGYAPLLSFEDGWAETIAWFRKRVGTAG